MKKRFARLPSPAMVVAVLALILAIGGTAAALTKKDKKKVTNIATSVFNKNAPTLKDSCPAGTVKAAGECFETSARAATDITTATANCGAAGRSLPSAGELLSARNAAGINLVGSNVTNAEMSSSLFRDGSNFGFIGVTDDGSAFSVEGLLSSLQHQYRCVAPPTNS